MKMGWIAAIAVAASAALASAESMSFGFELIPVENSAFESGGNNPEDLGGQLELVVSSVDGDPAKVDFTFKNNVGIRSSISELYFDDGQPAESLFSALIIAQSGASFVYGSAAPGVLPGGDSLDDPFIVSAGFLADAQGNPANGIDTSTDFVTIQATLNAGFTYDDVISRLMDGLLRVGLHVVAIGVNDDSDSYVTTPGTLIPLPSVAGLGMVGLAGVASRRRRS